jgi:hypothetical protein
VDGRVAELVEGLIDVVLEVGVLIEDDLEVLIEELGLGVAGD